MHKSMFRAYAAPAALLGFGLSQASYLTWLSVAYADVYTPSVPSVLNLGLSVCIAGVAGASIRLVHRRRKQEEQKEAVERLTREFEELDKNNVTGTERRGKLLELQEAITRLQR